MQSKFGRTYRHRSKPAICKRRPTAGPHTNQWPPPTGTGSISWIRTSPPAYPYNASGIITFNWDHGTRRYQGDLYDPPLRIHVEVFQFADPQIFAAYLQYWNGSVLQYAFTLPTFTAAAGQPINTRQRADLPGLGQTRVHFSFLAVPLIV